MNDASRESASSSAHRRQFFAWRMARSEDAPELAAIYNETIPCRGHSPQLHPATVVEMEQMILSARRGGWPMWSLVHDGTIVAWGLVRPLHWGPQICRQTGDFSVYVARQWYGSVAAVQSVLIAYELAARHGFEAVTCWILGTNARSLLVARGARMQRWGRLHGAANLAGRNVDVEIWGARYDDPAVIAYMNRLKARLSARAGAGIRNVCVD